MAHCLATKSVMSESLGYKETCGVSIEYLRRGSTYTPKAVRWAGDIVITTEAMLHQTKMELFSGGECEPAYTFSAASDDCGEVTASPTGLNSVKETSIRNGDGSFAFTVAEGAAGWDEGIAATLDGGCGGSMAPQDGGNVLFSFEPQSQIKSLCGSIERKAHGEPVAFYLDNRRSFSEDPDNGLLVSIKAGIAPEWEVRYAPQGMDLSSGLEVSDDVTAQFMEQIAALGMSHEDIFEFGMI